MTWIHEYEMGFVCDLKLVSLTSGNGLYVVGDQLRTDERSVANRRPPRSRSAHQSVWARSATRTSVPRVINETNIIETFEWNGQQSIVKYNRNVTGVCPVSSSVSAFGRRFFGFSCLCLLLSASDKCEFAKIAWIENIYKKKIDCNAELNSCLPVYLLILVRYCFFTTCWYIIVM